jgi:hypothetical protein
MKKFNNLILALFVLIFLMSCTTTKSLSPETQVVPLQTLAEEGDTILLIDATKEKELVVSLLGEDIGNRSKKITVQITPKDDSYPLENYDFNAIIEGDFPFFLTNFGLTHFSEYTKVLEDSKSFYKNENTEIGVIHKNMVGVSNTSYLDLSDTVDSKIENVDKATTLDMYGSNFALYSYKPKTLFDLGIGLTQPMISHFDSILLLVNENSDNKMLLDAKIDVDTEKNASTLERMIKAGYTGNLKKTGERLDFSVLKLMFNRNENRVNIVEMPLTDEQVNLLKAKLNSTSIGL